MTKVITEIPQQFRHLEQIVEEEFGKAFQVIGKGLYRELGRQFELHDALASRETWNSIRVGKLEFVGDRMSLEIAPTGDRARIMAFIEHGREAGKRQPPLEPIMAWLHDRKIVAPGEDPEKIRAIAWFISRQIHLYGIEPKPIFEDARRHYDPYIKQSLDAAARRVVKRMNATSNDGQGSTNKVTRVA